ncbi:hypothetical protein [Hasllibacter sp. MH4015]|uniref:hypothetical protein n=1 Tax=Hasllibacter sp. MH4015 TaxID=2854029 RepID=UPI001CD25C06|nr:hypothetical protein [Hasllibacter sp. MH4015]
MQHAEMTQYAHALYRARGDKAEVEAAQKARDAKTETDARKWERIRLHIKELRGARQT